MNAKADGFDVLPDGIDPERIITLSLHCGRCGYSLRMLPYVYACPECGNAYNARALKMEGIFLPYNVGIPFGDVAACLFSAAASSWFIIEFVSSKERSAIALAVPLVALTLVFAWRAYRALARFAHSISLSRRIEAQEREE